MLKFLVFTASTVVAGAAGFSVAAYFANEMCKDVHGHPLYPES